MARPPRRAARKPEGNPAGAAHVAGVGPEVAEATVGDAPTMMDPGAILAEFEAVLRDQPGIGQEGLDFLMPHLRDAVESASLQPTRVELDPAAWMETFDAVVGDALDEDERNTFVRQIKAAIEPFGNEDGRTALEFARRLQDDGEANALAWLAEQKKAAPAAAAAPPPTRTNNVPAGAQAITRSRSRRLRGPPA